MICIMNVASPSFCLELKIMYDYSTAIVFVSENFKMILLHSLFKLIIVCLLKKNVKDSR